MKAEIEHRTWDVTQYDLSFCAIWLTLSMFNWLICHYMCR